MKRFSQRLSSWWFAITIPVHNRTSERKLLSQADEAMYLAKQLGRNQVRVAQVPQQSLQPAG
jgi:PleD family two-component response regulator